jgi:hypothetical protein
VLWDDSQDDKSHNDSHFRSKVLERAVLVAWVTRCLCSAYSCPLCLWELFFVQVAGFARQAPPQSRPRYLWAPSETKVGLCCPHLNPLSRGGSESFARLARRASLVSL